MSEDARAEIMAATFDALCEHGYANLTMQSIADEFDKSKSLIHYHFDSKDDLLTAFMEDLFEAFVDEIEGCGDPSSAAVDAAAARETPAASGTSEPGGVLDDRRPGAGADGSAPGTTPADRLLAIADLVVTGTGESRDFYTALLELRAQAPHNDALREQLVRNDRRIRAFVADVVREGQARGQFDDAIDPDAFAVLFRSAVEGAQSHDVVLGDEAPTDDALAAVEDLLVDRLLVGEGGE